MRSSEGTCVAALERSLGDSPDGDVEFVATLEGREVRCINYDAWLLTQEYFDDLRFRGASFVVFGGFGSPLLVLEQDRTAGKGGQFWDCSFVLAEALGRLPTREIEGSSILELGCGCGLASIVAGRLGARVVVLTDGDPHVVALAARNARRDGLGDVVAEPLAWTRGDDGDDAPEDCWRPPRTGDTLTGLTYDRILVADCVYDTADAFALVATIRRHCREDTVVHLVTKTGRNHACARHFFEVFGRHFDYSVAPATTRLLTDAFSYATARLKASPARGP